MNVLWGLPINSLFFTKTIRLPEIEILLNYEVNTGNPIVAVVMRAPAKSREVEKGSFSKVNLLIRNNYIGIYTVCLPLSFLESKNISFISKN